MPMLWNDFFGLWQTVTEKHKMNVPETMNEVLDMSDDEGIKKFKNPLAYFSLFLS